MRAFQIAGLVFGVLSVVAASFQQLTIGALNKAVELRLWLSHDYDETQEVPVSGIGPLREYVLSGKFPLRSSLAAQQLIRIPFALLAWAVYCFLVGFGLYLGFAYANNVPDTDSGNNDNRNVLISFLVTSAMPIALFAMWTVLKASEQIGRKEPKAKDRDPRQRRLNRADLFKEVQQKLEPIKYFRNQQKAISTVLPRGQNREYQELQQGDGFRFRSRSNSGSRAGNSRGRQRPQSQGKPYNPVIWPSDQAPASHRSDSPETRKDIGPGIPQPHLHPHPQPHSCQSQHLHPQAPQTQVPALNLNPSPIFLRQLAHILHTAAAAHRQAAEADLAVAAAYDRLLASGEGHAEAEKEAGAEVG